MHNSKVNILIRAAAFCVLVAILLSLCNFVLYDDRTYTRLMFHEMYESEKPIDMVFISGSMTYKSFDPEIWDDALGLHTFNLGSSSQTPDASYYLLKEVFAHHSPKYVIFATNYISFMGLDNYSNPQRHYILFDYMKPSLNKLQYWMYAFDEHTSLTALLPFMRDKTLSAERIFQAVENVKTKLGDNYRNYGYDVYVKSMEEYQGRGYVYRYEAKEVGGVGQLHPVWFRTDNINPTAVEYFGKLVQLCKDNGAELIMVPTPLPYGTMALQEDYQQVTDFYQSLADSNGVEIFDFSLARSEVFYPKDEYFYDHVHLNGPASQDFSTVASGIIRDYLAGEEINKDDLFYSSFQELMDASPYIFNTWLVSGEDAYYATSTSGNNVIPEYRFLVRSGEDAPWTCIQDYGSDVLYLDMIPEDAVQIRLEARAQGSSDEYQQYAIINR